VALVDDIADLLTVHDEVNAVGGQRQERVVGVVQLRKGQAIFRNLSTSWKRLLSATKLLLQFVKEKKTQT